MEIISTPIDFLGVNNYTRTVYATGPDGVARELDPVPGALYTEMHWEVYPNTLRDLLLWLHHDYAPAALLVTENGSAFRDEWDGGDYLHDPERLTYMRDNLRGVKEALEQGAPVRGYFAWSLMDNFEWAHGYGKRFGVVYVDYPTQRRVIKDSGRWYAQFIQQQRS
jgi:beta-glucosidase